MSNEVFRQGEYLTAAKLNRILQGARATDIYDDNPPPPPGLTEADVNELIFNAISNLLGTPTGIVIDVSVASGNATVSSEDFIAADTLRITNATVANRRVIMPQTAGTVAVVSAPANTQTVTIERGTTTYRIAPSGFAIIYLDGSANFMRVLAASGSIVGNSYKVGFTVNQFDTTNQRLLGDVLPFNVRFSAGGAGSYVRCDTNPGATVTVNAQRQPAAGGAWTTFATYTMTSGGTGSVSLAATVNYVTADRIRFILSGAADVTGRDFDFTLYGTRY